MGAATFGTAESTRQRRSAARALLPALHLALLVGCAPIPGQAELAGLLSREGARYERGPPGQESDRGRGRLPELDEDATLTDFLAYGALANPGLEAAYNRWAAALQRVPQARALPDPRLSFGYFIQEVETRVGPQRAKVGVSQMFPWRGKRVLRGEVALHRAEAAHARYEAARLALFHRIRRAYWEYWYLSRAVDITEENLSLVTQIEGVARAKYAAGLAPRPLLSPERWWSEVQAPLDSRAFQVSSFGVANAARQAAV